MSPRLPRVTASQLIRALQRAGFVIHHQRGSHVALSRSGTKGGPYVIVPNHPRDIKIATLNSILRQSNMDVETLIDLL